jgi:acetamidase/formamidase
MVTPPAHQVRSLHAGWNRDFEPVAEVEPGAVVELTVPDASYDQIGEDMSAADLASIDFGRVNPVAGPVFVRGARPGDVLEAEVLEVRTRSWGWTAIVPGFGLMADEISGPWLRISRIEQGQVVFGSGVVLPYRPFPGTIGVAPAEAGQHPIGPPSRFGGNVDVRYLTAGARVLLPVGVEGALFSAGDGHATQGDGEVCGSAVETGMEIALRLHVRRDLRIAAPQLSVPSRQTRSPGGEHVTTGVAADLFDATRDAVRAMIEHLVDRRGLTPEEGYAVVSVAGELRIHEIVNVPHWVVGAAIPDAIFAG